MKKLECHRKNNEESGIVIALKDGIGLKKF